MSVGIGFMQFRVYCLRRIGVEIHTTTNNGQRNDSDYQMSVKHARVGKKGLGGLGHILAAVYFCSFIASKTRMSRSAPCVLLKLGAIRRRLASYRAILSGAPKKNKKLRNFERS